MVSNLPSDEPPHPDASPEASGPSRPRRLTLDGSSTVTFEVLQAEWEQVEDELPGPVGLRVHRALSWLERAEKEEDDPDAAFIFYWIAFNAAYAQDRLRPPEATERNHFAVFFNAILALDFHQAIYDAIWKRFSGPIRMILDNQFVFQPFWNYHAGRGGEDWERSFEHSKRIVTRALAAHDTAVILSTLFNRLYVLRIQLMHGGASWDSSVNRDQVRDGARIMAFLVPIFVGLMMSRPDVDWGPPDYPVVN